MIWMIYGANGYTARLIAELAVRRRLTPILAGRHPQRVLDLSRQLGLPARIFDLRRARDTARQLDGVDLVLNCAGPFTATAQPMLDACLGTGTHYLDITGEIDVFESIYRRSHELAAAGITAIPGVGFDVVPSDCLASMLKAKLPDAESLVLAFMARGGHISPGTAKTLVEGFAKGGRVRRQGKLLATGAAYRSRSVPFPDGAQTAVTIPWGDVSTAYRSTGIPDIEVYLGATPNLLTMARLAGRLRWLVALPPVAAYLKKSLARHIKGPSADQRARGSAVLWGEATTARGERATVGMRTPDGYTLTADAAVSAVARLLQGPPLPAGALTPSQAFGAEFVKELEGVEVLA